MTTNTTAATIGANVNEDEGTVTITANGVELATITLQARFGGIVVHTTGIQYTAPSNRGQFGSIGFRGAPSFSSESVKHELPEPVLLTLASVVGLNIEHLTV
jgi:hypothetical protein